MADIDDLCERFEEAWSNGEVPRIEEYLQVAESERRAELFEALLAIELDYHFRDAKEIAIDSLAERFPEFRVQLHQAIMGAIRREMERLIAIGSLDLEDLVRRFPFVADDDRYVGQMLAEEAALCRRYRKRPVDRSDSSLFRDVTARSKGLIGVPPNDVPENRPGTKPSRHRYAVLTVLEGAHQGVQFSFHTHGSLLYGSAAGCHLQPDQPSQSPCLFRIEAKPPIGMIVDLCDETHVNGQRVRSSQLEHGDRIRCGPALFSFECDGPEIPSSDDHADAIEYSPRALGNYDLEQPWFRDYLGYRTGALLRPAGNRVMLRVLCVAKLAPAAFMRFIQLTRALERLRHKRFVRWLEPNRKQDCLFVASEFYEETDFLAILRRQPVARRIKLACGVAAYVLEALHEAHNRGICHGMVCPDAIKVGYRGSKIGAKLADTRIERALHEIGAGPMPSFCGRSDRDVFASPERLADVGLDSVGNDLYGVAASLYYFLTEKTPHLIPDDPAQLIPDAQHSLPRPLSELVAEIPPLLGDVVSKGLARDPADRYPTAADFYEELVPFTKPAFWRAWLSR